MSIGLVIDRDRDFRRAVASWLKDRRWAVLEAEDRASGLELSLQQRPQLVLCDVLKSRPSGFQFCSDIHKSQDPANPCVTIATGNGHASERFHSLEDGADEYLSRPLNFEDFSAIL